MVRKIVQQDELHGTSTRGNALVRRPRVAGESRRALHELDHSHDRDRVTDQVERCSMPGALDS